MLRTCNHTFLRKLFSSSTFIDPFTLVISSWVFILRRTHMICVNFDSNLRYFFVIFDSHTFTFDWASNALFCVCVFHHLLYVPLSSPNQYFNIFYRQFTYNMEIFNFKNLLRHWHWNTHFFPCTTIFPCCNNDDLIKNRMHSGYSVYYYLSDYIHFSLSLSFHCHKI